MTAAVVYTAARATHAEESDDMDRESDPISTGTPTAPQSIRELRTRLGMTQEEFAHAIAVTVSTVNRWENGHATPRCISALPILQLLRRVANDERTPRTSVFGSS